MPKRTKTDSSKCQCGIAKRIVGDGCQYCNPQMTIAILEEQVAELRKALADAIRSPMGVIPASADGLVSQNDFSETVVFIKVDENK